MDENFATYWEAVADAVPEHTALVQGQRRHSWAAFEDRAARLAAALGELGLGPDSKVACYLHNCNEYVETTFATWKMRGVPVNVNYRYLEDELAYLLDNSDAEAIVFHGSLGERVANVRPDAPRLRAAIQVDDGSPPVEGALWYEELVAGTEPMPRVERSGSDLYFLYTGGTTGTPKAVMWRQEDLFASTVPAAYALRGKEPPQDAKDAGRIAAEIVEARDAAVHVPASPLMHGTGFVTTCQSLTTGGTVVTLESRRFDPAELWETVERERVRQMAIVGDVFAKPMLRELEEAEARGRPYDCSSLQLLVSSGVMWTSEVKEALVERTGAICYDALSASEGIGFATSVTGPGSESRTARFKVGEHTKVLTEDGREVEPGSGETGMLAIGGPIPLGYYKDEAKTAETFRELGGTRYSIPADYATVEADGTVTLLGRGSVCINTGGEKVYPEEVEEVVKAHPSVVDCVVVGLPDERWGEAVTAVVSLREGAGELHRDDLLEVSRGRLAGYKRPKHVVPVDEIRRGPSGKLDYGWARSVAEQRVADRS